MEFKSNKQRMESWKVQSPLEEGFFEVISPKISDCRAVYIYRLNLACKSTYTLRSDELEMNAVVISGSAKIKTKATDETLKKFDSFYIGAQAEVQITAPEDLIVYIGGALGSPNGIELVRHFDKTIPIGDIHQIHGHGTGEREVMFTCDPQMPAERLICGLTWSREGTWTSWPPHQHENDLEEVYCYFDMDDPKMGLHLSYLTSGNRDELVAHTVQSGTMILAPCGYHPTVAMSGSINAYFWVLAAFTPKSRRYDLAITDPQLLNE